MQFGNGHTLTRIRSGGTDSNGDPLPAERTDVPGCGVAPVSTSEDEEFRQSVITGYQLLLPSGYHVDATDSFVLPQPFSTPAERWAVVGEVQPWVSPFSGWSPGTIVNVRRRSG